MESAFEAHFLTPNSVQSEFNPIANPFSGMDIYSLCWSLNPYQWLIDARTQENEIFLNIEGTSTHHPFCGTYIQT